MRRIRTGVLARSAVAYRVSVVAIQTVFFWVATGRFALALGTSLGWNAVNMAWYWLYHYTFARLVPLGREEKPESPP